MTHFTSLVAVLSSFVVGCGLVAVDNDTPTAPPVVIIVPPEDPPMPPPAAIPFSVALSSGVPSEVYVKKDPHARLVAITVMTGSKPVTLKGLTLTGQAQIATSGCNFGMPCAREAFSKRVTSLALFDGDTQVGYAKAPDMVTGKTVIPNVDMAIPAMSLKTLVVKATLSSSASVAEPFDQVAVGIEEPWDPRVLDSSGESILGEVKSDIRSQVFATPKVVQTIRPSGELKIVPFIHPVTQIVIGGKDLWVPVAQYRASAAYEAIDMDRANIVLATFLGLKTDAADYTSVAIATGGAVKGQASMTSDGIVDVDMSSNPVSVPKNGEVVFEIWAKFASVQAWSTTPATSGVARSGHAPALALNDSCSKGTCREWAEYDRRLNVRSTGAVSGERVYISGGGVMHGYPMVIRKSAPIITPQPLVSTTLANIDQDLIKFQFAADSAGSIGWKQVAFSISKTSEVTISNFRLRRNTMDIDPTTYAVTELTKGVDMMTGSLPSDPSTRFVVAFKPGFEEVVSGSGGVYTLHATVSGAVSGSKVIIKMDTLSSPTFFYPFTGYLENAFVSPNIFSLGDLAWSGGGMILWSDMSEVPHSAASRTTGGSRDWTDDQLVEGPFRGSITLSK